MLYNPWSLNNKIDAFMVTLSDYSVDIAAVCETWLNDRNNPTTATIKSHGYSITHNFREGRKGGGTALIYKNCFALSPISFPNTFKSFELTAALAKRDAVKIIFVVLYRTGPLSTNFNQELDALLANVSGRCDSFVLAGDFNIHFDLSSSNRLISHTLELLNSYGLQKILFF